MLAHLQNDCGKVVQLCTTCNKVVHKEELAKHWEENKECGAAAACKSEAAAAGYVMHLIYVGLFCNICRSLLQYKQVSFGYVMNPETSATANGTALDLVMTVLTREGREHVSVRAK